MVHFIVFSFLRKSFSEKEIIIDNKVYAKFDHVILLLCKEASYS